MPTEHNRGAISAFDKETVAGWRKCIDNAHLFGCDIVAGFTGRVRGKSIDKSMGAFKKVWTPLAKRAKDRGVRIATASNVRDEFSIV